MRLGILEALSCICLILLVVGPVSSNSSNCDHDEIFDEDGDVSFKHIVRGNYLPLF